MQFPEKNIDLDKITNNRLLNKTLFFLIGLILLTHPMLFANMDSTGVKKIDGKIFVVHKVDAGQGLYGIARIYKTTVPKIQAANPGLGQSLSVGQTILVPYSGGSRTEAKTVEKPKAAKPQKTKTETSIEPNKKIEVPEGKEPIYHTVTKKENVYQIAENHKLTAEQLRAWNKADMDKLKPGQKIIVGFKEKKEKAEAIARPAPKQKGKGKSSSAKKSKKEDIQSEYDKSNAAKKTVTENGMGTWVDDGSMSDISLAMHKTAPAGTIIRLTNPMNGKVKYVKVVGQLPDNEDNKQIIIKISKNTASDLHIIDKDFRVRLDYSVIDSTGNK